MAGFAISREIVRDFETKLMPPNSAHAVENVIHRRCSVWARSRKFFIWIRNREPALIIFDHLGAGIARRDPVAKAPDIHRCHVALRFPLDHPLRKGQAYTPTLAEARHDSACGPIVANSGNRTDKRIPVRCESERTVDHRLDPRALQNRETFVGEIDAFFDLVEIVRQEFVPKIPRRAVNCPRAARLFVETDAQSAPLLAKVAFTRRVHNVRMLGVPLVNFGRFVCDEVLMLHRMKREIDPCHLTHFAGPEATGIDNVFGVNGALFSHHVPAAVRTLVRLDHLAMGFDCRPAHPRGLRIGMGGAGRV